MPECKIKQNKAGCNCSYEACAKKGICCECIQSHWPNGEFPACFFPDDIEKTYDRSIERFVETFQERGRWW